MKFRISIWDGREMHLAKEIQINDFQQVLDELDWIKEYKIQGEFLFVPENERDEMILDVWNKMGEKYDRTDL